MKPRGLLFGVCLLALAGAREEGRVYASTLLRGPYLQTATPQSMIIRWRTDVPADSQVSYGLQTNDLPFTLTDPTPVTNHIVQLSGLTPATTYYYSVGSTKETLASGPDCQFVTSPTPGQPLPTRIWVIGDSGGYHLACPLVPVMRDAYLAYTGPRRTDVWLVLGDNAYQAGLDDEYQLDFFDVLSSQLRQMSPWSTIGNHEVGSFDPNGVTPYLNIFSFPTNGEAGGVASGTELYYSFDYAHIHFICLDSVTQSRAADGPMANWLRADLAATTNQWIIAFWHHPPYTCGEHYSDNIYEPEMWEMRTNLVPILEAGGCDLVLGGHSHIYERSYLLHGHYGFSQSLQPNMILDKGSGRENDTGPYIKPTSGSLANLGTVYVEVGCSASVDEQVCTHPVMYYTELQVGSLVLDINSNRLDGVFLRDTGAVHDYFTIIKGEPACFQICKFALNRGKAILRWKSTAGQTYQVEQTDNLDTPNWQPASALMVATGATTSWTNSLSAGMTTSYYRVNQVTP
jgi:acid phosphatase type 7